MANIDAAAPTPGDLEDKDIAALKALIAALNGRDRKARQAAAHTIAQVAKVAPAAIVPFAGDIVRAVSRPEAQTRWEILDALANVASVDASAVAQAYEGAENALFDEDSGMVRLAAFRYFTALGASSAAWSVKAWGLIDEAIQCYHGDPEFDDMLEALERFARADLDAGVRKALVDRMSFDARSGKGSVSARARAIIEAAG